MWLLILKLHLCRHSIYLCFYYTHTYTQSGVGVAIHSTDCRQWKVHVATVIALVVRCWLLASRSGVEREIDEITKQRPMYNLIIESNNYLQHFDGVCCAVFDDYGGTTRSSPCLFNVPVTASVCVCVSVYSRLCLIFIGKACLQCSQCTQTMNGDEDDDDDPCRCSNSLTALERWIISFEWNLFNILSRYGMWQRWMRWSPRERWRVCLHYLMICSQRTRNKIIIFSVIRSIVVSREPKLTEGRAGYVELESVHTDWQISLEIAYVIIALVSMDIYSTTATLEVANKWECGWCWMCKSQPVNQLPFYEWILGCERQFAHTAIDERLNR